MTTYDRLLAEKGISLSAIGLREFGLTRQDALIAVDLLHTAGFPVLGGDVYFAYPGGIESAYAN